MLVILIFMIKVKISYPGDSAKGKD